MTTELKSATIENTGSDDAFPGTFQVVLSTATKDRDGEEVKREEWQEPLPDHITFDVDHGMSVEKTVGSGRPYFDDDGRLLVDGTYSSLPLAQDTRTLVKEGHVRSVSVAFARHVSTEKDGTKSTSRELLNGAFVAVPANPEAVVLAAKAKAKYDAAKLRAMLADGQAMENPDGNPSYPIADREDLQNAIRAVGRGAGDHDKIRSFIRRRARALGLTDLIPDDWSSSEKSLAPPVVGDDAERLAEATDAALDEAMNFATDSDTDSWPDDARQFLHLVTAAWSAIGQSLEASGSDDPDADTPDNENEGGSATDEKSAAVDALDLQYRALAVATAAMGA